MTQEQKELLLKDLCARLSYDVIIHYHWERKGIERFVDADNRILDIDKKLEFSDVESLKYMLTEMQDNRLIIEWKPYLRPLLSMNGKEREELRQEQIKDEQLFIDCIKNHPEMRGLIVPHFAADWCDKNMFDHRGLIPKGLAIEVTNKDNPYKEKLTPPDKIYLKPLLTEEGDSIVRRCTFEKLSDSQIEYTRTDAFVEKACTWLNENITNNPNANSVLARNGCVTLGMLVDDFKKCMEE